MRFLDLIFYRLLFLYRAEEKDEAIDSAANYLTTLILAFTFSLFGTIFNVFFRETDSYSNAGNKPLLFVIVAPLFFILSYFIKQSYKRKMHILDITKYNQVLKFNLFTLWLFIVFLALFPIVFSYLLKN